MNSTLEASSIIAQFAAFASGMSALHVYRLVFHSFDLSDLKRLEIAAIVYVLILCSTSICVVSLAVHGLCYLNCGQLFFTSDDSWGQFQRFMGLLQSLVMVVAHLVMFRVLNCWCDHGQK